MTKQTLRNTIIDLLDDEDGINSKAHDGIAAICTENGWEDINTATELECGRAFLWEGDADSLRQFVVKEGDSIYQASLEAAKTLKDTDVDVVEE